MKVLVTGGSGMLGRSINKLIPDGVYIGKEDADLTSSELTEKLIKDERPDLIIHAAAKVGGILSNMNDQVGYFEQNTLINTNVIKFAHKYNVKNFIGIASACIYEDNSLHYPLREDDILNGTPQKTNLSYSYAKRGMIVHIKSYIEQYDKKNKWCYVIPSNLYGENDVFEGNRAHFISALINKVYEAKEEITLMGTGSPMRQFLYTDDLSRILYFMIENNIYENINIAPPYQYTIRSMAEMCVKISGKTLNINFDHNAPDGQFRRDLDTTKLNKLIPNFDFTPLEEGMRRVYDSFSKRYNK